jgi:hypothetical protein
MGNKIEPLPQLQVQKPGLVEMKGKEDIYKKIILDYLKLNLKVLFN